jgi:uncharacterized protein YndB with AHSA1/START domain
MYEARTYSTTVRATPEKVWTTMLGAETYPEWTKAFSENSVMRGVWGPGETIDFLDPGQGGTRAVIEEFEPPHRVVARHIAVLGADEQPINADQAPPGWIGATETYVLRAAPGGTELLVEMVCGPEWFGMFDDCWPRALVLLKGLAEQV